MKCKGIKGFEGIRASSVHLRYLICAITLTVSLFFTILLFAGEKDIPYYRLDPVVITAGSIPEHLSKIPQFVTIITREEIDTLPAKSIPDLLEYINSVDIRQRGMSGVLPAIFV